MLSRITEVPSRYRNVTLSPPIGLKPYFSNHVSNKQWNADGACSKPYKLFLKRAVLPGGGE
eukprot:2727141-Rhodomonas_salina.1